MGASPTHENNRFFLSPSFCYVKPCFSKALSLSTAYYSRDKKEVGTCLLDFQFFEVLLEDHPILLSILTPKRTDRRVCPHTNTGLSSFSFFLSSSLKNATATMALIYAMAYKNGIKLDGWIWLREGQEVYEMGFGCLGRGG